MSFPWQNLFKRVSVILYKSSFHSRDVFPHFFFCLSSFLLLLLYHLITYYNEVVDVVVKKKKKRWSARNEDFNGGRGYAFWSFINPLRIEPSSQMDELSFNYANEALPMQYCYSNSMFLKDLLSKKGWSKAASKYTLFFFVLFF